MVTLMILQWVYSVFCLYGPRDDLPAPARQVAKGLHGPPGLLGPQPKASCTPNDDIMLHLTAFAFGKPSAGHQAQWRTHQSLSPGFARCLVVDPLLFVLRFCPRVSPKGLGDVFGGLGGFGRLAEGPHDIPLTIITLHKKKYAQEELRLIFTKNFLT